MTTEVQCCHLQLRGHRTGTAGLLRRCAQGTDARTRADYAPKFTAAGRRLKRSSLCVSQHQCADLPVLSTACTHYNSMDNTPSNVSALEMLVARARGVRLARKLTENTIFLDNFRDGVQSTERNWATYMQTTSAG